MPTKKDNDKCFRYLFGIENKQKKRFKQIEKAKKLRSKQYKG